MSWAWTVNPPGPSDDDYPAYLEARKAEAERLAAEIAATPAAGEPDELARAPGPGVHVPEDEQRRLAQMMVDGLTVSAELAGCLATFREWLHLPDPGGLYVTLATVAANRAAGDPVWLLMVSPPGGGKTEMLSPLVRLPDVKAAATLTEAALLSGTPKRDRDKASKGGLLREIGDFGILVAKDFGSVLSMHRDARASVLAALREIYDGTWTRHVGTDGGRTLEWSGKIGLIAGCTPAIDSHHAVIGSMGERFVMYRLPPTDADSQVRRALAHVGREKAMRQALGEAVTAALEVATPELLVEPASTDATERLVSISTLAVRCRSAVERDSYSREVQLIPEPEAPARLALVLLRLLNGLRAIGVDEGTSWALVTKCALDSMPSLRRAILGALLARDAAAATSEIAERVRYPTNTARRALEDLTAHGIAERHVQGPGQADLWQATAWTRQRWLTVPEMSGDTQREREEGGAERSISPPLRVFDDFSGTVRR
jgi:hypothetical protein